MGNYRTQLNERDREMLKLYPTLTGPSSWREVAWNTKNRKIGEAPKIVVQY